MTEIIAVNSEEDLTDWYIRLTAGPVPDITGHFLGTVTVSGFQTPEPLELGTQ